MSALPNSMQASLQLTSADMFFRSSAGLAHGCSHFERQLNKKQAIKSAFLHLAEPKTVSPEG